VIGTILAQTLEPVKTGVFEQSPTNRSLSSNRTRTNPRSNSTNVQMPKQGRQSGRVDNPFDPNPPQHETLMQQMGFQDDFLSFNPTRVAPSEQAGFAGLSDIDFATNRPTPAKEDNPFYNPFQEPERPDFGEPRRGNESTNKDLIDF